MEGNECEICFIHTKYCIFNLFVLDCFGIIENITSVDPQKDGSVRISYAWTIGPGYVPDNPLVCKINMGCRESFGLAYNATEYFVRLIMDEIRKDYFDSKNPDKRSSTVSGEMINFIQSAQREAGEFPLSDEQIRNMREPDGIKTLSASEWMRLYFSHVACKMPNGEWQIEQMDKTDVYMDYKKAICEVAKDKTNYLSYNKFLDLWALSYSRVKIKAYKQVTIML